MNLRKLLFISALVMTVSAVSCGKDNENTVSSVEFSLNESSATEETTEATTEQEETTTTAVTTTGTETTTTATDTTTETTAESATTTDTTSTTKKTTKTTRTTRTTKTEANENPDIIPDESESGEVTEIPEEQTSSQPQDTTEPDETQQGEENTTEPVTEPPQNSLQFSLDNLLSDASGIISSLGTPDYEGVSPACTSNGKDVKTYQYKGLEIQCYVDGGSEYIFGIEITENIHSTDKGITVGSSRAEVETAYGTGMESGGYTVYEFTANDVTREIDIKYSGDTVVSVIFYTPV